MNKHFLIICERKSKPKLNKTQQSTGSPIYVDRLTKMYHHNRERPGPVESSNIFTDFIYFGDFMDFMFFFLGI